MDLISRESVAKKMLYRRDYVGRPSDPDCIIADEPSVPAVPLDKLCEWLAGNAYAFECKDCEEYCRALLECENEVGGDPEYWENKLTKWMEGLDGTD